MVEAFNKVKILDIPFENSTKEDFLKSVIEQNLFAKEKCFVVTANPEIVMETRRDENYKEVVLSADYIVPDGTGILFAAKYKKQPLAERIAGFDLMQDMLHLANEQGASCFFLGASEEVNKEVVGKIQQEFPNIIVAGRHHGYFKGENAEVSEAIRE